MIDGLLKSDDGAALRFFEQADKNTFQSEKQGRPIFDQVLFVEVITPGSRESAPIFELERVHARETGVEIPTRSPHYGRFVKQIEAFRSDGGAGDMRGTPLASWPALDIPMIATLNEGRVYTVEGLCALSDEKLRVLGPGGYSLRERAQAFLAAASGGAPSEALAAENKRLTDLVAQHVATIATLQGALAAAAAQPGQAAAPAFVAPAPAPAPMADPFAQPQAPAPAPLV